MTEQQEKDSASYYGSEESLTKEVYNTLMSSIDIYRGYKVTFASILGVLEAIKYDLLTESTFTEGEQENK